MISAICKYIIRIIESKIPKTSIYRYIEILNCKPFNFNIKNYKAEKEVVKSIPKPSYNKLVKIINFSETLKLNVLDIIPDQISKDLIKMIIDIFVYLISIIIEFEDKFKNNDEILQEYSNISKKLGYLIKDNFNVSPTVYLHVLVYHIPDYLKKYPHLFKLSNFTIENTIKHLKDCNTNGFNRDSNRDALYQQLSYFYRNIVYRSKMKKLLEKNLKVTGYFV